MSSTVSKDSKAGLQTLLAQIDDLPSIPETLIQILRVLDDKASGPSDLAEVVRLDAPLMAKILRLANSPYYSSRGDLADINRCVAVLGYRTVRQVAICISVATSLVSAVRKAEGTLDYRELWRHSVVTGAVAKYLAKLAGHPDPEEIFTGGLLHDMGKFVLEIHAPEMYGKVIADRRQKKVPLVDLEKETFGYDHAEIGAAFGDSWRFPDMLIACFSDHHTPVTGAAQDPTAHAVALVALADYVANTLHPCRCDHGFDPLGIDVVTLHANAKVSVELVEENLAGIEEAVGMASAFLDLG